MSLTKRRTGYQCAFQILKGTLPPDAWEATLEQMRPVGFDGDDNPIFEHSSSVVADGFAEWMLEDFKLTPLALPSSQSVMRHRRGECVRCGRL